MLSNIPVTVFVVDDNEVMLKLLMDSVSSYDKRRLNVFGFRDPNQCLHACTQCRVDVLVSDFRFAGTTITGVELMRSIRGLYGRSLPTVFVTGDSDLEYWLRVFGVADVSVLSKPLHLSDLHAVLTRASMCHDTCMESGSI